VNAGVGDINVDLTGEWRQDADVRVSMGLGSLELRVPEGIGIKLQEKTFLTSVDTQGLIKRGDAYYSLDWDEADRRVTIDIQAAFGDIDIRWVPDGR
jgi:predicted membrane protein